MQLVGVSAMLIASKNEDIYAPEIRDFIYITDKNYSRDDILNMEGEILQSLSYDVLSVYSITFLNRYHFLTGGDKKLLNLASLILEISLMEYTLLEYKQSIRACCALYIARKIMKIQDNWNGLLITETGYNENDLNDCLKDMLKTVELVASSKALQSSIEKYSSKDFDEVSLFICNKV